MKITNPSNTANTVKGMLLASNSDNYCIDKCIYYCDYKGNIIEFGNILDQYRDYFESTPGYIEEVEVPEEYYYQPNAFAEYYYGTVDLDFLVLYFSRITDLFEFNKPKIRVFSKTKISDFNKLIVNHAKSIRKSYENPIQYIEETL